MNIAESFKKARLSRNVSQDQLSEQINVTISMISQIERGLRIPSANILIATARYLNCTTDSLLGLEPPTSIGQDTKDID